MLRMFDKATRHAKKATEVFVQTRYPAYQLGRSVFRAREGSRYVIAVFVATPEVFDVPGQYLLISFHADTGECEEILEPLDSPYAIRGLK